MRAIKPLRLKQGRQTGHDDGNIRLLSRGHRFGNQFFIGFCQFCIKALRINDIFVAQVGSKSTKRFVEFGGIDLRRPRALKARRVGKSADKRDRFIFAKRQNGVVFQ